MIFQLRRGSPEADKYEYERADRWANIWENEYIEKQTQGIIFSNKKPRGVIELGKFRDIIVDTIFVMTWL